LSARRRASQCGPLPPDRGMGARSPHRSSGSGGGRHGMRWPSGRANSMPRGQARTRSLNCSPFRVAPFVDGLRTSPDRRG
jgi:hypothetical protein